MCIILIVGLIVTLITIYIIFSMNKEAFDASYSTLGSYGYTSPPFEPDILRRCAEGSYMYSSNPNMYQYCDSIPKEKLERVACMKSYRGNPVRFEYTSPAYGESVGCGMPHSSIMLS
jgi:hypothetical protein